MRRALLAAVMALAVLPLHATINPPFNPSPASSSSVAGITPLSGFDFDVAGDSTLYVRNAGTDTLSCGTSVGTACQTLAYVLAHIPSGWVNTVRVNLGAESYTLPTVDFSTQPGMTLVGTTALEGRIHFEGDCTTPITTFVTSGTGTLVASRVAQTTYTVSAWAGTISDGTHFVRFPTSSTVATYSFFTVRASTSPTLALVKNTTTAFPTSGTAEVCPYATTITVPTGGRFNGILAANILSNVRWDGVKFSAAITMRGTEVRGSHFVGNPTLQDTTITQSYVAPTSTVTWTATRPAVFQAIQNHVVGCFVAVGPWVTVSSVSTPAADCSGGSTAGIVSFGSASGTTFTRDPTLANMGTSDIERVNTGATTCVRLNNARVHLTGAALTCNLTGAASGLFAYLTHDSWFGNNSGGSTIGGSVTGAANVENRSTISIFSGSYTVVNTAVAGQDFTLDSGIKTVSVAQLPAFMDATGTGVHLATVPPATAPVYTSHMYDLTTCVSSASPATCTSATSGFAVIPAGATTVTVNTTAVVGATTTIDLTGDSTVGASLSPTVTCNTTLGAIYEVTAKVASTSFTISTDVAPLVNPKCVRWKLTN